MADNGLYVDLTAYNCHSSSASIERRGDDRVYTS